MPWKKRTTWRKSKIRVDEAGAYDARLRTMQDALQRLIAAAKELAAEGAAPVEFARSGHDTESRHDALIAALRGIAALPAAGPEISREAIAVAYQEARTIAMTALVDAHALGDEAATSALIELADERGEGGR